jgi:hypothetical protein
VNNLFINPVFLYLFVYSFTFCILFINLFINPVFLYLLVYSFNYPSTVFLYVFIYSFTFCIYELIHALFRVNCFIYSSIERVGFH